MASFWHLNKNVCRSLDFHKWILSISRNFNAWPKYEHVICPQGEQESEEDAVQLVGSLQRCRRQPPRPHWRGNPALGRRNHPQCDRSASDWGRRVWFRGQQCYVAKRISRWSKTYFQSFCQMLTSWPDLLTESFWQQWGNFLGEILFLWEILVEKWWVCIWEGWISLFERENFFLPLYIHPSIHPSTLPPPQTRQQDGCHWQVRSSSADLFPWHRPWGWTPIAKHRWAKYLSQPTEVSFCPTLPRSHTSRSLLHRTFLPRAPPAPGPADCSRPGHGVQVGGFMAIVNKLNQKEGRQVDMALAYLLFQSWGRWSPEIVLPTQYGPGGQAVKSL